MEIRLTRLGGETILEKIITNDYDTVAQRPKLNAKNLKIPGDPLVSLV